MAIGKFKDPKSYALKLLSIRLRSEEELRRRLKRKGFREEDIDKAIKDLKETGLLNDREFAEAFYESKSKRLWSSSLIASHLKRFGISGEIIEEVLRSKEDEALKEEIVEKMKSMVERSSLKDEDKVRRRLYNYLRRRGFSHSFIMDVLKEIGKT